MLAHFVYSPTSPFLFLLSEHKHCDNAATNWKSENARSRTVVSLRRSVVTETKWDESSTERFLAAVFHHVTARSRLARVFKLINSLFIYLIFRNFFGPRPTVDIASVDTATHLYSVLSKTLILNSDWHSTFLFPCAYS